MSCWCNGIDYECQECIREKEWQKLNIQHQLKLIEYCLFLKKNPFVGSDFATMWNYELYLIKHGLNIDMVPDKEKIHGA
jgi:hypothetical protein